MLLEKKGWKRCVCVVSEQLSDDGGMFCVYVYMSVYICLYTCACMYAACVCVCVYVCTSVSVALLFVATICMLESKVKYNGQTESDMGET